MALLKVLHVCLHEQSGKVARIQYITNKSNNFVEIVELCAQIKKRHKLANRKVDSIKVY